MRISDCVDTAAAGKGRLVSVKTTNNVAATARFQFFMGAAPERGMGLVCDGLRPRTFAQRVMAATMHPHFFHNSFTELSTRESERPPQCSLREGSGRSWTSNWAFVSFF